MQESDGRGGKWTVSRTAKMFAVEGTDCVGHLYHPVGAPRGLPAIVMGHGFSGTQQGSLARTAEGFAARGFAVWTFDYRGFGDSGGEPRQLVDIDAQLADWRAAIAFARRLDAVDADRVVLWGSSLSGGLIITIAASDPRIAAVISQIPFNGFPKRAPGRSSGGSVRLVIAALYDALRGRLGFSPAYVPVIGSPGERAIINSGHADKIISAMAATRWENRIAPRAIFQMARYRPASHAPGVRCPALICVADRDRHTPPALALDLARLLPRAEVLHYAATHFEFYEDALRLQLMNDQLRFLQRVGLGGSAP